MKVLSIGNSFSEDSHKWLHKLAVLNGEDIQTVNLFIGGCSLETHWNNHINNKSEYDVQKNGGGFEYKSNLLDALNKEKWDVITIQQASNFSGMEESFEPYLSNIIEVVKKTNPNAKLYFHQTWAYEIDSDHGAYGNYNHSQKEMYNKILNASEFGAKLISAKIIPTGKVIQTIRETVEEFDYANGGLSLNRDGFHLSFDYGRFAAAATWLRALTGITVSVVNFEDFDPKLLNKILEVVNSI